MGKTTACRRLSGLITDISSSREPEQPSTGVIETGHSVIIKDLMNSTLPPSEWTVAKDLNEEACMLLQFFYGKSYEKMLTDPASTSDEKGSTKGKSDSKREFQSSKSKTLGKFFGRRNKDVVGEEGSSSNEVTSDEDTKDEIPSIKTKVETVIENLEATTNSLEGSIRSNTATKGNVSQKHLDKNKQAQLQRPDCRSLTIKKQSAAPSGLAEVSTLFRKAVDSRHWKDIKHLLKDMTLLKMEDTGGQPEFMDMLPALTTGPALYLLFCKLTDNLHGHHTVTYLSPTGESTVPVKSTDTVEEVLLTALASISWLNSDSNTHEKGGESGEATSNLASLQEYVNKSVAYIIGTHKDLVSEDQIVDFDEKLQSSIRSTEFFSEDLVQFSSAHRMIFSIDNMHGGAEEIKKIRKFLEHGMKRHFKKLSIPAAWLVLSLCLRKREERTASLQSVLKLAGELRITASDAKLALWFLHHCAGVIMYFPDVLELKDTVICDIQVVYDSVTKLVVNTFKFGSVSEEASERFRSTGQFSWDDIRKATANVSGDYVPLKKLITLLEHLKIITPIAQPVEKSGLVYFMPCVLQSATHEELDEWLDSTSHPLPPPVPLFIRYHSGYAPMGVFPAMITHLVAQKKLVLVEEGIKKNRVRFRFGEDDTVTFISHPRYYGVHIERERNSQTPTHELCGDIREMIQTTLQTVTSQTNYGYSARFELSFECPKHPGREHFCSVSSDTSSPTPEIMHCMKDTNKPEKLKMEDQHLAWFGKVSNNYSNFSPLAGN